jgi:hypothetical protein
MESGALPLTLYSAADCCLCHELHDQITRLQSEFRIDLTVIDITGNPELEERFRPEIPVLFIHGRKAVKYRISTPALREKLLRALDSTSETAPPLR